MPSAAPKLPTSKGCKGFTLIEVLVAAVVMMLAIGIVLSMTSSTARLWKMSSDELNSFQSARGAFEMMTRTLSQATLNVYHDYYDANAKPANDPDYDGTPVRYGRKSELHFIVGKALLPGQVTHAVCFQAPLGTVQDGSFAPLDSLLNACGYYVTFGSDSSTSSLSGRPAFLDAAGVPLRYRFRLMEFRQPSEALQIFEPGSDPNEWFKAPLSATPPVSRVVAENVIALVLLPKEPDWVEASKPVEERIGATFEYDSRTPWASASEPQPVSMHQLCPVLKVIMVVLDETSARRLEDASTAAPDLGIKDLFQVAANLDADMETLKAKLTQSGLNYRVYQTEVAMRGSKWSAY